MYENWTYSLCLSIVTNQGKLRLLRIADIDQSTFHPYEFDRNQEMDDENRDIIFHPSETIPSQGDISIWRWSSQNNYQTSAIEEKITWIEYIQFDDVFSLSDLKRKLRAGISSLSRDHNYLFVFERLPDKEYACLFLRGKELEISATDGKARVAASVYKAPVCIVNQEDVAEIKTWRIPELTAFYFLCADPPEPERMEQLRDTNAIIAQIIRSRINKYSGALDKKGKSAVRLFLDFIPDTTLVEDIAEQSGCDAQAAAEYLKGFLKICEEYIQCEDFDAKLLIRLAESDTELASKIKDQVEADWEVQHADTIIKANEQIAHFDQQRIEAEQKYSDIISQTEVLERQEVQLEKAVAHLTEKYNQQLSIADSIVSQVHEKIAVAKNDLSNFFSKHAMYTLAGSPSPSNNIYMGYQLNAEVVQIQSEIELIESLRENLEVAGVAKEKRAALTAYLLSAYTTHTPLILAGVGAQNILDALSATIQNKTAVSVYRPNMADVEMIKRMPNTAVVGLYNAFDSYILQSLCCSVSTPYICLIALTGEELTIEPRGFFNFALPLYTECFIDSPCKGDFEGSYSSIQLSIKTRFRLNFLPEHTLSPMAMGRCREVLATTESIANGTLTSFELFLLQTIPIMLAQEKKEELLELISSSSCTEKEIQQLRLFVGDCCDK